MGSGRQYCLKWNNHPSNVATVFDRLRLEELFVDVTLATSDRQVIRAHRVLLSAGSAYLERVLAINPCEHPTIVLSNIRYKELKLLVDFMYCGQIAVDQAQFPALMESANWLMVRGLCTQQEDVKEETEEKEVEEEEAAENELTVTPSSGRKRQHSEESEEEEEQIPGPGLDEEEEEQEDGGGGKQSKVMYPGIHGVPNALWMMTPERKEEGMELDESIEKEQRRPEVQDQGSKPPLLTPSSLNDQLVAAMQLCANPYLQPLASLQKRSSLDLLSPNSSFSGFPTSPFKSSSPTSPMKSSLLMSSAPVRRYKQYTEDSLQAALKEIMNGQSINRSSMKHNIPARTLRDWMKRLNIKSVFTHHSNNRGEGRPGEGRQGDRGTSQGLGEDEGGSLASNSPEPGQSLPSPTFGLSPTNLSMMRESFHSSERTCMAEDSIEEEEEGGEEAGLRIDEGRPSVTSVPQIAQAAN